MQSFKTWRCNFFIKQLLKDWKLESTDETERWQVFDLSQGKSSGISHTFSNHVETVEKMYFSKKTASKNLDIIKKYYWNNHG